MECFTKKLFYDDFYTVDFKAVVIECYRKNDNYFIILDRTLFYPEGGGQPGDNGKLNNINVLDTFYFQNSIVHLCDTPIKIGTTVIGKINWDCRYKRMQSHSGEHIVSGIIKKLYGYNNIGFSLNDSFVTMDYDGKIYENDLLNLEIETNRVIQKNLPIIINKYSSSSECNINYRSKKQINEELRIVTIPDVDDCACCGTHVKSTSEINLIHIAYHEYTNKGTRLQVVFGNRALEYIYNNECILQYTSKLLSSPKTEIPSFVKSNVNKINNLTFELTKFKRLCTDFYCENGKLIDKVFFINLNNLELDCLNYAASKLYEHTNILIISGNNFFLKFDNKLSNILNNSKNNDLYIGGGKNNFIRGILKIDVNKFIDVLNKGFV